MANNRKRITVKDYTQKISSTQYLPENLVFDLASQKNLEEQRNMPKIEKKGNLRLFANNVTKHWDYPAPPHDLQILKFVDKRYFSRVILYFMFNFVVESLIFNRRRSALDLNLRSLILQILDTYFASKKIKRKLYENLSELEKNYMIDQFLANFWGNLIGLDLISISPKGGIISLKKETTFMLFDELITMKFRSYPCVFTPKAWDITGQNGGYYITPTKLVTTKPTYMGKVLWSPRLVEIINNLQNDSWSIDFPIEYLKTDFTFKEDVALFNRKKGKSQEEKEMEKKDVVQHLHTRFFLEHFASKVSRFFYPYTMDFRGRIYPLCSWGYSATSSKKIRQCLRTSTEHILTERGAFWLKILLAHILKLNQKTYQDTAKAIQDKWSDIPKLIDEMPHNYTKHYAKTVYNDIKRGSSSLLIQLDATSSVYQIIGIIINDKKLMEYTNLLDNEDNTTVNLNFTYKDIYTYIEDCCRKVLPNDVYSIFLERSIFKGILMPLIYGKTLNSNVNDLVAYITTIGTIYNTGTLVDFPDLYNQYKALQAYPIKKVLSDLPENLRQNYLEILKTVSNEVDLFYWKKRYMAHAFFHIMTSVLYTEFPKLKQFTALFTGQTPVLKHATYSTPYFTFQNMHRKVKKNRLKVTIKDTTHKLSFPFILNQLEKRTSGEAANCVHSLDAFILHYILDHRGNIPMIPIHDCLMVHPNDADATYDLITEAYKALQEHVSTHNVFSQFHRNGSELITSHNIFKFEYKEVESYEDDVIPNYLEEDSDDEDYDQ